MVNPQALLTDAEGDRIAQAVRDAERQTSGEIRVLVVAQSLLWGWLFPILCAFCASVAAGWAAFDASWGYPSPRDIAVPMGLAGAGVVLVLGSAVWFTPIRKRAVRRRAEREFVRLGIASTQGRTGVLLMLSLRERMVQVLADKAIHEKLPPSAWEETVNQVVGEIRKGRTADGLCQAVRSIGERLATHFPRRADDVNELPDRPETRP